MVDGVARSSCTMKACHDDERLLPPRQRRGRATSFSLSKPKRRGHLSTFGQTPQGGYSKQTKKKNSLGDLGPARPRCATPDLGVE
jgi:hypothetical protein